MVVKTVVEAQDIFDKAWEGFKGEDWKEKASVSRFVQANYTPYDGDESFLAGPTERSLHIKKIVEETKAHYEETRFPYDTRPTSIADIAAGYIDKENELIFGIQNDELFKLNFMPRGGIRMAETTLKENGYEPDPAVHEIFTKYAMSEPPCGFSRRHAPRGPEVRALPGQARAHPEERRTHRQLSPGS